MENAEKEASMKTRCCTATGGETSHGSLERKSEGRRGSWSSAASPSPTREESTRLGIVDLKHSTLGWNQQKQGDSLFANVIPERVQRRKEDFVENATSNLGSPRSEKTSSVQGLEKTVKCHDFSSENFMLKKTEEITNFNVGIYNEVEGSKSLEKEGISETEFSALSDALGESDSPEKELKMCMVNERGVRSSSKGLSATAPSGMASATSRALLSRFKKTAAKDEDKKVHRSPSIGGIRQVSAKEEKSSIEADDFLEAEVNHKEDLRMKEYLKEFHFYILFLALVTFVGTSMVSQDMFYFTDETASIFFETPNFPYNNVSDDDLIDLLRAEKRGWLSYAKKTLRQSNTYADFWAFAESTMLDMFYWDFYYSYIDPIAPTPAEDRKVFYSNQILGVPRMRQVRVRNDSCHIHPDVKRFFRSCYYYYSVFSEETRPIREDMGGSITASAWVYTEAEELQSTLYWGEISIYGGGGYYIDLSKYRNNSWGMVRHLKENLWLTRATRAIFIDFNLYNANVNLFCICKIVCEFPPVGGMVPSADFIALKLIQYLTIYDFFILGCEMVLLVFVAYYTYQAVLKIRLQKGSIFFYWWNYVDFFMLFIAYAYITLNICAYIFTSNLISQLSDREDEFTDFNFVKTLKVNCHNLLALLLFAAWVKLYRFLKFSVVMVEFRRTLSRSVKDIIGFIPMFMILFIAFALLAYLIFGTQVKHYNTIWFSFLSLLEAFLGGFQYREIQESNHILGPIFYIGFIFFIFFVLLNVFVAIINDAYSAVKSEVISDVPDTGQYIKRGFLNLLGISCCHLDRKLETKTKIKKEMVMRRIMRTLRHLNERIEQMEGNLQPVIDKVDILIKRL